MIEELFTTSSGQENWFQILNPIFCSIATECPEADKKHFPGGLKAVTEHCHEKGCEVIVWFEVERVSPDTWITKNHPEWVHGDAGGGLLKMDEPEVVQWVTDHIDKMISEEGIDLYRSDFNIDPLAYWRGNDTEDRQGITEIQYIEGYLSYWDELRRRHPGMLIDSCASVCLEHYLDLVFKTNIAVGVMTLRR